MPGGAPVIKFEINQSQLDQFHRTLRVLQEEDAQWLRAAMDEISQAFARQVEARAKGGMKAGVMHLPVITRTGSTGKLAIVARGAVRHPGAKAMEFGRTKWWAGYMLASHRGPKIRGKGVRGNARKGREVRIYRPPRGQIARPFVGIRARDQAIAATLPYVSSILAAALIRTWTSKAA